MTADNHSSDQNFSDQPITGDTPSGVWDDPRITAYVLGELQSDQRSAFEAEMRANPDLAKAVDEAGDLTGKLESLFAAENPPALDANRRTAIAAATSGGLDTVAGSGKSASPAANVNPAANRSKLTWTLVALAAGILVMVGILPKWIQRNEVAMQDVVTEKQEGHSTAKVEMEAKAKSSPASGLTDFGASQPAPAESPDASVSTVMDDDEVSRPLSERDSPVDRESMIDGDFAVAPATVAPATVAPATVDSAAVDSVTVEAAPMMIDDSSMERESLKGESLKRDSAKSESLSRRDSKSLRGMDPAPFSTPQADKLGRTDGLNEVEGRLGEKQPSSLSASGEMRSGQVGGGGMGGLGADPQQTPRQRQAGQKSQPADAMSGGAMDGGQADLSKQLGVPKDSSGPTPGRARSSKRKSLPSDEEMGMDMMMGMMDSGLEGDQKSDDLAILPEPEQAPKYFDDSYPLGEGQPASGQAVPGQAPVAGGMIAMNEAKKSRVLEDGNKLMFGRQGLDRQPNLPNGPAGGRYEPIVENDFKLVADHPLSTFSIDVDTASYSKVREYMTNYNQLPPPGAVRIEELINYFPYSDAPPADESEHPFGCKIDLSSCPWNPAHRLARIAIKGKTMKPKERPACNLVFLIDTSGSMSSQNKLPLVIDGLKMLTKQLQPKDRVAIVVYASSTGLVLDSTPVSKPKKIRKALTRLSAGGSTNGGAGIALAYQTARDHFIQDGVNRVILCTDGDFNVGTTSTDQLVSMVEKEAKGNIFLSVLGFGMDNHNDEMLEKISGRGNGNYAFIDNQQEARKVLVDQAAGTLVTIAKDVKIQVEFNPANVAGYRLIGYENRMLAKEDFNDDKKDAGEIGAGHSVTALYEWVPADVNSASLRPKVDELKYQSPKSQAPKPTSPEVAKVAQPGGDEAMTVKLRYKQPDGDVSTKVEFPVVDEGTSFAEAKQDFRFTAAVASFGMQLRGSRHAGDWNLANVIEVAKDAKGSDQSGLRQEFVSMAKRAAELKGQRSPGIEK